MQSMALRTLSGRNCRHAAPAAAPTQRHRLAQARYIRVQASAEAETVDNIGYKAVEELQELERSGTMDFAGMNNVRCASHYPEQPSPCYEFTYCTRLSNLLLSGRNVDASNS